MPNETTKTEGEAAHHQAARMIIDLACSQVRNARDLGSHAKRMGISFSADPFAKVIGHDVLSDAWRRGHKDAADAE